MCTYTICKNTSCVDRHSSTIDKIHTFHKMLQLLYMQCRRLIFLKVLQTYSKTLAYDVTYFHSRLSVFLVVYTGELSPFRVMNICLRMLLPSPRYL